jgi:hypothetical protein
LHQEVEALSHKHPRLGYRKLTRLVRGQLAQFSNWPRGDIYEIGIGHEGGRIGDY